MKRWKAREGTKSFVRIVELNPLTIKTQDARMYVSDSHTIMSKFTQGLTPIGDCLPAKEKVGEALRTLMNARTRCARV